MRERTEKRTQDIQPLPFSDLKKDEKGYITCVVQDSVSKRVLMVAFQDEEAWEKTFDTGYVHFHSRSRGSLWMKGETSGNTLALSRCSVDCDRDAVLLEVEPVGPTCHTGETSCFRGDEAPSLGSVLDGLTRTIKNRADADSCTSYTAKLLEDGDLAARKVLEEAGELAFAAKDTRNGATDQRVVEEAADLLYHTLTLLAEQEVTGERVAEELISRRN